MTSNDILDIVNDYYGVDISRKTRKRHFVYIRSIAYKLSKEFTIDSLESIGKVFGTDHATVIYSLGKFDDQYIYQVEPIDVSLGYHNIRNSILELDNLDVPEINCEYNALLIKHNELLIRHNDLKIKFSESQEMKRDLFRQSIQVVVDGLSGLSDESIYDFIETRLNPFKRMKKTMPKVIVEVKGAKLN